MYPEEACPGEAESVPSAGKTLTRARLIIVDDHPDMREAVVRLLEPDFEIVTTLGDGAVALEAVTLLKPDVVILDISIPVLTGLEVARRLKAGGSTVKIVFLTVMDDPDFVREAFAAGGSAYVVKSRLTTDLRLAINEILAGHVWVSPPLASTVGLKIISNRKHEGDK